VRPPRPGTTERQLREQVRSLCSIFGWRMAFTQYSLRSPKGLPDLQLVRPPRLIYAELKSETGKVTPEQQAWLDDLRRVPGVEAYLWKPSQIEAIAEILR
jgi:hypothetical protein